MGTDYAWARGGQKKRNWIHRVETFQSWDLQAGWVAFPELRYAKYIMSRRGCKVRSRARQDGGSGKVLGFGPQLLCIPDIRLW